MKSFYEFYKKIENRNFLKENSPIQNNVAPPEGVNPLIKIETLVNQLEQALGALANDPQLANTGKQLAAGVNNLKNIMTQVKSVATQQAQSQQPQQQRPPQQQQQPQQQQFQQPQQQQQPQIQ